MSSAANRWGDTGPLTHLPTSAEALLWTVAASFVAFAAAFTALAQRAPNEARLSARIVALTRACAAALAVIFALQLWLDSVARPGIRAAGAGSSPPRVAVPELRFVKPLAGLALLLLVVFVDTHAYFRWLAALGPLPLLVAAAAAAAAAAPELRCLTAGTCVSRVGFVPWQLRMQIGLQLAAIACELWISLGAAWLLMSVGAAGVNAAGALPCDECDDARTAADGARCPACQPPLSACCGGAKG